MPSSFNIEPPGTWSEEDRKQFTRLPVWMARQQHLALQTWNRYTDLFPSLKWKPNSGDVMLGVRPMPSPIANQVHRPRAFLSNPLINTHSVSEQNQKATIRRHRYMSNPFHWEGDFADFRDKQVKTAQEDLTRQLSFMDDFFIRDQLIAQSRRVWVVGRGLVENVPYGEELPDSPIKTAAWWQTIISQVGADSAGTLDFKTISMIRDACENDLNLPFWEGGTKKPADNEILKGKYLMLGAGELYSRLTYDASVTSHRPLAMNLLNSRFKGVIGENIVFRSERFPLRVANDGTFPAQEIELQEPSETYGTTQNIDIVANPAYRDAGISVALLLGYAPMSTIEIGPPPAEFNGSGIAASQFNKLNWNGQVEATKNILVQNPDGSYDTNKWGDRIQLLAQTTHGALPEYPRFILPIIYRRDRYAAAAF